MDIRNLILGYPFNFGYHKIKMNIRYKKNHILDIQNLTYGHFFMNTGYKKIHNQIMDISNKYLGYPKLLQIYEGAHVFQIFIILQAERLVQFPVFSYHWHTLTII